MALNRVSAVSVADCQSQTHVKLLFFTCEDFSSRWKSLENMPVYVTNYVNTAS